MAEKAKTTAALNLLSVLSPIDWDFVFAAPMNGGEHNAQRIKDAMAWLEKVL